MAEANMETEYSEQWDLISSLEIGEISEVFETANIEHTITRGRPGKNGDYLTFDVSAVEGFEEGESSTLEFDIDGKPEREYGPDQTVLEWLANVIKTGES